MSNSSVWRSGQLPLVVLCGGRSSRFGGDLPKTLVPVNGRPLVWYVIDYWRPREVIFVVSRDWLKYDHPRWIDGSYRYVIQGEPLGIAHAISKVEGLVAGRFIVTLGDCVQRGHFSFPDRMLIGVGAWDDPGVEMLRRSNMLLVDEGMMLISSVEKPMLYTGMGTYFFDTRVFRYIHMLPHSERGELEVNDLLQAMVDAGEPVSCVPFTGDYLNVTYPDDIRLAEEVVG